MKNNFPFTKGEGKRRKFSFRSPRYSFLASYDANKKAKKGSIKNFERQTQGKTGKQVSPKDFWALITNILFTKREFAF